MSNKNVKTLASYISDVEIAFPNNNSDDYENGADDECLVSDRYFLEDKYGEQLDLVHLGCISFVLFKTKTHRSGIILCIL